MRRKNWSPSALSGLVFLFSVSLALAQNPPTSIQIFMPNGGLPVTAIKVTLVRDDGFTDRVFSDSKGKVEIPSPRGQSMTYAVTIETDNQTYDTTTVSINVQRTADYFTIFLRPLKNEKPPAEAVVDVTNFEGNVPAKAGAAYKRAMFSINSGQLEEAVFDLKQAIGFYPQYVRAYNDLGVLFMQLERLDEAAAAFRKAVEISKRFFHPRMNLGLVLNRQGKFKESVELLKPLYDENHGVLELRLAYIDALMGVGDFTTAEKICRSTLESKQLTNQVRAKLQDTLGVGLVRQGKFAEAVVELEKALKLNPNLANTHLQLGGALMQLQQLERAESELLLAYRIGGKSSGGAQLLLGHIYYGQKKYADAQRAFEQYLKDVPTAPNAPQITQLIADLKVSPKN